MKSLLIFGILSAGIVGAAAALAQDSSGVHARELFYTPPASATPATAGSPAASSSASTASKKTAGSKSSPKQTAPPAPQVAKQSAKPAAAPVSPASAGGAPLPVVPASAGHTVAAVPLGVRYSVLKRNSANQFVEIDSATTFHSGDRIRIQVKANTAGYLYVVAQGSSGTWQVLFPSADVAGGSNRLEPGDTRQIPSGDRGQFVFDDRGGTEKLFLVLARQAEPDLDKLIYTINPGGSNNPSGAPGAAPPSRNLVAQASVTNDVIDRVRAEVASRDLVFEKVDGEGENAAYVVNPSPAPDARLVVDLSLKHQ